MHKKLLGMALAGASLLVCATAPAMAQFELTFDAYGDGTLNACTGTCSFGPGPDNGTVVTDVWGVGGNGYDFPLPLPVVPGLVGVYNSTDVLVAVMVFTGTDLDYVVSGTLSNYPSLPDFLPYGAIADPSGSFTYAPEGAYPADTQYNGTIPQTAVTPVPAALPLFAGGLGALGLLGWRRKRKAQVAA